MSVCLSIMDRYVTDTNTNQNYRRVSLKKLINFYYIEPQACPFTNY